MNATIRPHRAQDLGRILRLCEEPASLVARAATAAHLPTVTERFTRQ